MKIRTMVLKGLLLFLAAWPAWAAAAERPDLVSTLSASKEVVVKDANGKSRTEWREVKSLEPGDLLKYTLTYANRGKAEARGAVIVDPIPAGTVYISNSAVGEDTEITFSLDGKNFQAPPLLKFKVKSLGLSDQEFSATPEMYTHIKWKLTKAVPPGGKGKVGFMVKTK